MTVGIIGVGNMGSAIAKALRIANPSLELNLLNRSPHKIEALCQELEAQPFGLQDLDQFIQKSDFIFIGVKPKDILDLFNEIQPLLPAQQAKNWVSMLVGFPLEKLESLTPENHSWIRMMPNIPIEIGQGYITYTVGSCCSRQARQEFNQLFDKVARLEEIPETLFDISGAIAGSGPAFVYQFIEALADAGVRNGLKRELALDMAAQTVKGAAAMILETYLHPAILKDKVTSPGGTTIEGIVSLENHQFRSSVISAVQATVDKTTKI